MKRLGWEPSEGDKVWLRNRLSARYVQGTVLSWDPVIRAGIVRCYDGRRRFDLWAAILRLPVEDGGSLSKNTERTS